MNFFDTHISPRAIELVNQVLHSGWVNEGDVVRQFENALAEALGVQNPIAVNSGTSALHLALVASGVGPGDEVIVPAQTFVATATVVLMQRATPVFADVHPETGNLDPPSVASRVTERTRAIIPVHWGGYPCDLDALQAIASRHDLSLIEDAAHALGATYKGQPIGAISRFTAFSFQAIKHLTTGDGGLICCRNEEDALTVRKARWFGIDRAASKPSPYGARGYDIATLGYKYHMNNVAAALGLGNLEAFPARLAKRRAHAAYYREHLAGIPGLKLPPYEADREHAYWFFSVLVERQLDFIRKLADHGVPTSVIDFRIDRNSIFGGMRTDMPGQEAYERQHVALPVHDRLEPADLDRVVSAIRSGW